MDRSAILRNLIRDMVLNAIIPYLIYTSSKHFFSSSELTALLLATSFPAAMGIYDFVKKKELNPVAITVLLGIMASIIALFFTGDPKILLIRESLFTVIFGVVCLVSLFIGKPIMFYFGRYFYAEKNEHKLYNKRWERAQFRFSVRLITFVWGIVFISEFTIRVLLVYNLPAGMVLVLAPIIQGTFLIITILWTFRYVKSVTKKT